MNAIVIRRGSHVIALLLLVLCSLSLAQTVDRSEPPKLGPPPSLKLPPIQHLKLQNGIPVTLMEKHEVPLVQIELIVMGGSADDPKEKKGIASMTAAMMEEGAGTRSSLELADAIDFLGADISAFAGQHTSGVSLHTPLSKLDSALALFADVAMRPLFPPEELERNRKELLTTLMQWHDEPRAIASVLFSKTLFGENSPYGVPSVGNVKSINSMTVDDLRKFHDEIFVANNANIIVSGDITANTLLPKLDSYFDSWRKGTVPQIPFPEAQQVEQRKIHLVDKPGAPQSEIRIGRIGTDRMTPDFYPLIVMNTILGGSFSSRLNHNLREEHGYTYGAYSGFDFRLHPGPFVATSAVQTQVTDKALTEFVKELQGILQTVSDDELERAKNYVALRYPENFQAVSSIAGQLADLIIYHLPDDYFNTYTKNVMAVSKEDVKRVADKYIDPGKVAIIIVGDRKEIEPGIAALNLGPIVNLSIDDVLGAAPSLGKE